MTNDGGCKVTWDTSRGRCAHESVCNIVFGAALALLVVPPPAAGSGSGAALHLALQPNFDAACTLRLIVQVAPELNGGYGPSREAVESLSKVCAFQTKNDRFQSKHDEFHTKNGGIAEQG